LIARSVSGVKATAGNPVSIVTRVLLETCVEANPFLSLVMLSAPILRGRAGTGVAPMKTRTLTEATDGVGELVPGGVGVEVGGRLGVLVGATGEPPGVGVIVAVRVGMGDDVDVGVGVGVRVLVRVGVAVGVAVTVAVEVAAGGAVGGAPASEGS